MTSVPAVHGAV